MDISRVGNVEFCESRAEGMNVLAADLRSPPLTPVNHTCCRLNIGFPLHSTKIEKTDECYGEKRSPSPT